MSTDSITYNKRPSDGVITVYLGNMKAGEIREVTGGYQYRPKNSKVKSDVFPTLVGLKRSLESDLGEEE